MVQFGFNPNAEEFVPTAVVLEQPAKPAKRSWADVVKSKPSKLCTAEFMTGEATASNDEVESVPVVAKANVDVLPGFRPPPGLDLPTLEEKLAIHAGLLAEQQNFLLLSMQLAQGGSCPHGVWSMQDFTAWHPWLLPSVNSDVKVDAISDASTDDVHSGDDNSASSIENDSDTSSKGCRSRRHLSISTSTVDTE